MFTDIVGYSHLMNEDEAKALAVLHANRTIHKRCIQKFEGKLLKEMGDGMLVAFQSPSDAVNCAQAIHTSTQSEAFALRIGIHLGEVVLEENDVFGDGVNVASRIEGLARPGQTLVSVDVYRNIRNKAHIESVSVGSHQIKGFEDPIELFQVRVENLPDEMERLDLQEPNKNRLNMKKSWKWVIGFIIVLFTGYWIGNRIYPGESSSKYADRSIAVLPFKNESANLENQYFCNGMMEAILNHLSKIQDLRVISRNSVEYYRQNPATSGEIGKKLDVRYIVEGSVQRSGDRAIIFAQLIETQTDAHLWSQAFDENISDVFTVQAQITKQIADELHAIISPQEQQRIEREVTQDLLAYDYYLQGKEFLLEYLENQTADLETRSRILHNAELFYSQAIERDSLLAEGYVGLGFVEMYKTLFSEFTQKNWLQHAQSLANRALQINSELDVAHFLKGILHRRLNNKTKAIEAFKQAINLNPNYVDAYDRLGLVNCQILEFEKGIRSYQEVQKRVEPEKMLRIYETLSGIFYRLGDVELYQLYRQKSGANGPDWYPLFLNRKFDQAREALEVQFPVATQGRTALMGWIDLMEEDFEAAVEKFQRWEGMIQKQDMDSWVSSQDWHRYGHALIETGNPEKGRDYLHRQIDIYRKKLTLGRWDEQNIYLDMAGTYAVLGDKKRAYQWLDKLLETDLWVMNHAGPFDVLMRFDPQFDNLRGDEAFQQMVERMTQTREKYRSGIRDFIGREEILL